MNGITIFVLSVVAMPSGFGEGVPRTTSARHTIQSGGERIAASAGEQAKSSRRRLKKLSGKERRFAHHTNHVISKQLVKIAQGTGRGIALEDLSGIRDRVTVRRKQRATLHSWSFFDLRLKISYKAQLAGVPLVFVDPRYTSQACSVCGCIDKRNRPNQATFSCVQCGFAAHADHNAAVNIGRRAAINQPNVSDAPATSA